MEAVPLPHIIATRFFCLPPIFPIHVKAGSDGCFRVPCERLEEPEGYPGWRTAMSVQLHCFNIRY